MTEIEKGEEKLLIPLSETSPEDVCSKNSKTHVVDKLVQMLDQIKLVLKQE